MSPGAQCELTYVLIKVHLPRTLNLSPMPEQCSHILLQWKQSGHHRSRQKLTRLPDGRPKRWTWRDSRPEAKSGGPPGNKNLVIISIMVIAARALGFPRQHNPVNQKKLSTETKQPSFYFSSLFTFKINSCYDKCTHFTFSCTQLSVKQQHSNCWQVKYV